MREGVIQQTGTPTAIYDYPANRFVAGFLGTPQMNFFESIITKKDQQFILTLPDGIELPLSAKKMRKIQPTYEDGKPHPIIVGIRPEHLHVEEKGIFRCQVNLSEILGSETLLYCQSKKNGPQVSAASHDIVVKVPSRLILKNGTQIALAIEEDKIQLFDAESEVSVLADDKGEFSNAPALSKKSEAPVETIKTKKWWSFLKRKEK
jgi:multiple sugar transport system ATP-binding protein